jgi:hypothetical protein
MKDMIMKYLMIGAMMFSLSACGIAESMEGIAGKMNGLNDRIDAMAKNTGNMEGSIGNVSKGIHSQALSIALNELLKPENTKYITLGSANPIPMIPAAKGLAELATQEELVGLTYIFLAEINTCQVESMTLTKEQKDKYDLDKFIKLTALQLIASFAPQKTVDEMIEKQIIEGGSYIESAYHFITLRSIFTKDVLVDQFISATSTLQTLSQFENALTYLEALSNIANYPFASQLKIKIYGMYDTDSLGLNQTIESTVTKESLTKYYQMLSDKLDKDLKPEYKTDAKTLESIKARINNGLGKSSDNKRPANSGGLG